jgi:hypothetical protein
MRWSGPWNIVGRTLVANRLLAGSACGKRQRGRPLNAIVRSHANERGISSGLRFTSVTLARFNQLAARHFFQSQSSLFGLRLAPGIRGFGST